MRGCLMSVASYCTGLVTPGLHGIRDSRFVIAESRFNHKPRIKSPITNHESRITNPIGLPPDADFRVVPQHEPVRARLDRFAIDFHVFADQAVDHAVRKVAKARTLEDDTVLDLGIANLDVVHYRRERPDVC